ncbi:hypothetical protein [Planococcus sp. YIM B11945]|uniref:hypothetical protein n=1 Tax=Planococcus sp. YIM B11945 TaxID=3435410 RepID=UPI003D7C8232
MINEIEKKPKPFQKIERALAFSRFATRILFQLLLLDQLNELLLQESYGFVRAANSGFSF